MTKEEMKQLAEDVDKVSNGLVKFSTFISDKSNEFGELNKESAALNDITGSIVMSLGMIRSLVVTVKDRISE